MTVATDGGEATDATNGDLTGTTFAGLEVGAVVDRDLISTTYRATGSEPVDDVAAVVLRVVSRDLCVGEGDGGRLYRRFQRHAAHALTFEHPNALASYEVGEYAGQGYLTTADLASVPLDAYLDEHGPLDITSALALFEQIADVLDAGHRAGLTHGAVSPSTLRIVADTAGDEMPTPVVAGHGIGALLESRIQRDRKQLRVVDELLYVAPEQLRRQPPTGRADQYAMACAFVHALTGEPPFVRDTVGGLFGAHLFVAPRFDDEIAAQAIAKALAKEPRERYGTCGQMIADITRARRSAANRAAARRRHATLGAERAAAGVVTAATATELPATSSDVERGDGGRAPADRMRAANGAAPPADRTRGANGAAPPSVERRAADADDRPGLPIDDNSSTARQHGAAMSYPSEAEGPADGSVMENEDDRDGMPLLSEVLRQSPVPQRAAWWPPGVWVAVMVLFIVAAAAAVWLVGA